MKKKTILIVLVIASVLVILGISKCGSLQAGAKALETIAELKEANLVMKNKVADLERGLTSTKAALEISEAQTKELSTENALLKKLNEERLRKVWSMYEPGT
ncbi:DUF945 family protein [Neptunomonas concharum]|uniref:DUF945 domain-containing protein n=1 Tax=Neptunomonas concharum TaxID=1031538 RepID=A0A5P1RC14_9GAMM|nr:DUF945 family protein [Neptunomonas concharum]QEQ96801.1 DUF945 domain-containing protein [Neptunomonas concharum]